MRLTISSLQKRRLSQKGLKALAKKILLHEKIKFDFLSLVLVSDSLIRKINKQFLSRNQATDVLAFELSPRKTKNKKQIIGEIIISTDTAERNAKIYKTSFQYEISLYLIHGILHLLGFDDTSEREQRIMRLKEKELLNLLSKK